MPGEDQGERSTAWGPDGWGPESLLSRRELKPANCSTALAAPVLDFTVPGGPIVSCVPLLVTPRWVFSFF